MPGFEFTYTGAGTVLFFTTTVALLVELVELGYTVVLSYRYGWQATEELRSSISNGIIPE